MHAEFSTKFFSVGFRWMERNWMEGGRGLIIFAYHLMWGRRGKGRGKSLTLYDLKGLADVRLEYGILYDNKRTGWALQAPVRRVY